MVMDLTLREILNEIEHALEDDAARCRDALQHAVQNVQLPANASKVPWATAMSWYTFAKSGAVVFSEAAAAATKRLSVPIWIIEQASKPVESLYLAAVRARESDKAALASDIKRKLMDAISYQELAFCRSPLGQAIVRQLAECFQLPSSPGLFAKIDRSTSEAKLRDAVHQVIRTSGVLVTTASDAEPVINRSFAKIFNKVYELYLASPFRRGLSSEPGELLSPRAHVAVVRDTNLARSDNAIKTLTSATELTEQCTRFAPISWLAPNCQDSFRAAKITGEDAFVYLMTHVGAFKIETYDPSTTMALAQLNRVPSQVRIRVVEVIPVPQEDPNFISSKQIPVAQRAIKDAYFSLVRKASS